MSLADIIRSAVERANDLTGSAQALVSHAAWTANDQYGAETYATAVERMAVVTYKRNLVKLPSGREVMSRATVLFLYPIDPNGAAGRREPVDPRDRLVLPDGTTGPILDVTGNVDPATGRGNYVAVTLG